MPVPLPTEPGHRARAETSAQVLHVVPGPSGHGITRHALELVQHGRAPYLRVEDPAAHPHLVAEVAGAAAGRGVHLHLNDTLLGDDTVGFVQQLGGRLRVSATLHDLPDPREGQARYARRARAYTEVWRRCVAVVVASAHERELLRSAAIAIGVDPTGLAPVEVVPLPLAPALGGEPVGDLAPVVAVLGYVYPGKGHDQALTLAADLGLGGVVALGATSPGHGGLERELRCHAERLGISWEVTGFLDDDELLVRARGVALPLSWHAHVSASGSIGSWLQAGRKPLVADGGWVRELEARCPGSVTIVADEQHLVDAARAALAEPGSTFLAPGTRLTPTIDEAWAAMDRVVRSAPQHTSGVDHDR